jgi:hypothetical protein
VSFIKEQTSDEKSGENEKQIDTEESARKFDIWLVIGHDAEHSNGPEPVKAWAPPAPLRWRFGLRRSVSLLRRH